jgi:hypothetical protein
MTTSLEEGFGVIRFSLSAVTKDCRERSDGPYFSWLMGIDFNKTVSVDISHASEATLSASVLIIYKLWQFDIFVEIFSQLANCKGYMFNLLFSTTARV